MPRHHHLDAHFFCTPDYVIKVVHREPEQDAVAIGPVLPVADRAVMVVHFEAVQLQHQLASRQQPLILLTPVIAPATQQPLRNIDTANIAMTLLGTPAVTGSYFRPEMDYTRVSTTAAGEVVISWPLYLTGYTLQTASDVNGIWTPVTTPATGVVP